jgi:hypothetical protein
LCAVSTIFVAVLIFLPVPFLLIFFSSFDDKLGEFGPEKEIFVLIYIVFILDISIVNI